MDSSLPSGIISSQNLDIAIVTFSARFKEVSSLISSIRQFTDNRILLLVNGDYDEPLNMNYVQNILKLSLSYDNIVPIILPEFRSLSKLWNTSIIFSDKPYVMILNDDTIWNNNLIEEIDLINLDILLINDIFSHFVINKLFIDELGYFDERFLGVGWEDSDLYMRYYQSKNKPIPTLQTNSISHQALDSADTQIKKTWGKYSAYNLNYAEQKYDNPTNTRLSWGKQKLPHINPYPLENYFLTSKNLLHKKNER